MHKPHVATYKNIGGTVQNDEPSRPEAIRRPMERHYLFPKTSNIDRPRRFALRHGGLVTVPPETLTGDGEFDGVHHMPESQSANRVLTSIAPSSAAKEFIEFWLQNSVHADEQMVGRRGREAILKLADRLVVAAGHQGFSKQQIDAEIGDICTHIRASVDAKNSSETTRLRLDGN
jgi:hypothetical protein